MGDDLCRVDRRAVALRTMRMAGVASADRGAIWVSEQGDGRVRGPAPFAVPRSEILLFTKHAAFRLRAAIVSVSLATSLLPTNLAAKLIEDSLPWDRAKQFHVDNFLDRYSLHDSHWIALHVDCGWGDTVVAAICFDPVWNPTVSAPTSLTRDWPFLFLRFAYVSNIQMTGFAENGGRQRGISSVSVEHLSGEQVVTTIRDHDGAHVSIRHFPLIDALAMSPAGELLPLQNGAATQKP